MLSALDTTTDGELVDYGSWGVEKATAEGQHGIFASSSVRRLQNRISDTLADLENRKGPEKRLSVPALVGRLCQLWERETGAPVTSSSNLSGDYTSQPRSAAGRFIAAVVEAMQPSAEWIERHEDLDRPIRAEIILTSAQDRGGSSIRPCGATSKPKRLGGAAARPAT